MIAIQRRYGCQCLASSRSSIPFLRHSLEISQNNSIICKFLCRTLRYNIRKHVPSLSNPAHKVLKVAIVGSPNAGKSTLINRIVGRHVFAVSSKVHTTRCRARAVMVMGDTQLVFLDTPGVVDVQESTKHNLERVCMVDSEEAIKEADIVGVIHDVSNNYTMFKLDTKVLRHLFLYPMKPSFLILNKIDKVKSRPDLLNCVNRLTTGRGVLEESENVVFSKIFQFDDQCRNKLPEKDLQDLLIDQTGWPYFRKVFMVSALTGDGVGDIQMYLLDEAEPGEWLYKEDVVTDQNDLDVIERTVFSKLLDHLPNVVPYNVGIQLDYFNRNVDGSVTAVVILFVKKAKLVHFIKGKGGQRIKKIAAAVEQNLRSFYLNDVHIRLVIAENKGGSELKRPESAGTADVFCTE